MARKPKPQVDGIAPEAGAAQAFAVFAPIKFSGMHYAVGDTIELTRDEYYDLPPGLVGRPEIPSEMSQIETGEGEGAAPDKGSE